MVFARKLGRDTGATLELGTYAGFPIRLVRQWGDGVSIQLCGKCTYSTDMGEAALGNITRLEHLAERMEKAKTEEENNLLSLNQQLTDAKEEMEKPFPDEERLLELQKKKVELDLALEFKDDGEDMMTADEEESASDRPSVSTTMTLEQGLYQKLMLFAAPVLSGEAYYMKLQSEGFEDLAIEAIDGGEYSIAHYYGCNGDAMRDPEITFTVDKDNRSIDPTSYLQDDMGIFYATDTASPAQVKDLKQFMSQWFTNIKNQGFEPVKVKSYEPEDDSEEIER
jgi:hypothetical protein